MVKFPPFPKPTGEPEVKSNPVELRMFPPLVSATVVALIEIFPPLASPLLMVETVALSTMRFPTVTWTSAPESAPEVDVTMELPGLSETVSLGPALSKVPSVASLTESTSCPPLIKTVLEPLTFRLDPDSRETDPKEENDVPSTFGKD
jgi:hypothetical protein